MQVDLDFQKNKIKITDTVRAVSYFTAVDSVESEQEIGQFLRDEPLEETIQKTKAGITKANVRVNRHKEWTGRLAKNRQSIDALGLRLAAAKAEAEMTKATVEALAKPELVQKEIQDLYNTILGGPINDQGVLDVTNKTAFLDS